MLSVLIQNSLKQPHNKKNIFYLFKRLTITVALHCTFIWYKTVNFSSKKFKPAPTIPVTARLFLNNLLFSAQEIEALAVIR